MNLARFYTEIQRNAELSMIKIVEDYLTKQNKHKNRNKNKISNKKVLNYKPRFTTREHKPTSQILTLPPTDTTTNTQNTQQDSNNTRPPQPHNILNQPIKTTFPPA